MGTRSLIGIKVNKKEGKFIYCYWNGYPEYNGKILQKSYDTVEKVEALINLGNLSSLGNRISPSKGEPHSFTNPAKDVVVAYHRDRGEDFNDFGIIPLSINDINDYWDIEWLYVYDPMKEKWYIAEAPNNNSKIVWSPLKKYMGDYT